MSDVYTCNFLNEIRECSDTLKTLNLALVIFHSFSLHYTFYIVNAKKLLFRDMALKSMNGPQQIMVYVTIGNICIWLSLIFEIVGRESASFFALVVHPFLLWGVGFNLFCYVLFIYILYWLQVLEVKRTQKAAEAARAAEGGSNSPKAASSPLPGSPKPQHQESLAEVDRKSQKLGRKVLSLAKKRHYYSRLAGRISVAGILVNIIPTAIIAANNDGTDEGMKLRQVAHAILNFLTAAQLLLPFYVIITLGKEQVALTRKRHITRIYYINTSLFIITILVLSANGVNLILLSKDPSVGCTTSVTTIVFGILFILGSLSQIDALLRLPLKNAKKALKLEREGGAVGGPRTRRSSTAMLKAHTLGNTSPIATAKVALALTHTSNTEASTSEA